MWDRQLSCPVVSLQIARGFMAWSLKWNSTFRVVFHMEGSIINFDATWHDFKFKWLPHSFCFTTVCILDEIWHNIARYRIMSLVHQNIIWKFPFGEYFWLILRYKTSFFLLPMDCSCIIPQIHRVSTCPRAPVHSMFFSRCSVQRLMNQILVCSGILLPWWRVIPKCQCPCQPWVKLWTPHFLQLVTLMKPLATGHASQQPRQCPINIAPFARENSVSANWQYTCSPWYVTALICDVLFSRHCIEQHINQSLLG